MYELELKNVSNIFIAYFFSRAYFQDMPVIQPYYLVAKLFDGLNGVGHIQNSGAAFDHAQHFFLAFSLEREIAYR